MGSTADGTEEKIRRFVLDELVGDPSLGLGRDEAIFSSGLLSSIQVVMLMHFLEDEYGVRIDPGAVVLDDFDTLARIQALLARLPTAGA